MILDNTLKDGEIKVYKDLNNAWAFTEKEIRERIKNIEHFCIELGEPLDEETCIEKYLLKKIDKLQSQLKEKQDRIDKAKGLLEEIIYLSSKNAIIYKNNIEILGVNDRLNELEEILGDKENELKGDINK